MLDKKREEGMLSKRKRVKVPRKVQNLRSNKYKFSVKVHPTEGFISLGLGAVSAIVLIVSCYMSYISRGNIGEVTALVNMFSFITAIAGTAFAILGLRKKDVHTLFPTIGAGVNELLIIVYLVIYVSGTLL